MRMPWKSAGKWCVVIAFVMLMRAVFGGWDEDFSLPYYIGCYTTIIMLATANSFSDWIDRVAEEER